MPNLRTMARRLAVPTLISLAFLDASCAEMVRVEEEIVADAAAPSDGAVDAAVGTWVLTSVAAGQCTFEKVPVGTPAPDGSAGLSCPQCPTPTMALSAYDGTSCSKPAYRGCYYASEGTYLECQAGDGATPSFVFVIEL